MAHQYKFMCHLHHHMEALNIIIMIKHHRLIHIYNCLTLFVLTPLCSPYTPIDYAHLFADYESTSSDYTNFSIDCAQNYNDCVNTLNDQVNIVVDSINTPDISSIDFYIPNHVLL
jgi:hypothetical protein